MTHYRVREWPDMPGDCEDSGPAMPALRMGPVRPAAPAIAVPHTRRNRPPRLIPNART